MSRRITSFLIAGCALLLALELPHTVRSLRQDLRGPYASSGVAPRGDSTALGETLELPSAPLLGMLSRGFDDAEFLLAGHNLRD